MEDVIEGEMYPNPFAVQAASTVLTCDHFVLVTLEDDGSHKIVTSNKVVGLGLLKIGESALQNQFFKNNLGDTE